MFIKHEEKDESDVQQNVQLASMHFNCIFMRNNSGAMQDLTGRLVRYGLGHVSQKQETKSSDLIGITRVVITPDMVGKTIGVFTAGEIKKPGWKFNPKDKREVYQKNFIDWVIQNGGIAGFISSVDNLKDFFRR